MKSKKHGTDETICKSEIETQTYRADGHQVGEGGRRMNWENGNDIFTLIFIEQVNSESLPRRAGNST